MTDLRTPLIEQNGVTIVIPVYGDLPSLEACIASVLAHADEAWIQVLVINDCGPDADVIEHRILELIDGRPRVSYARNPGNLGFVRTCNRAVFELDKTDNDILLLNSDAQLTPGAVAEMRAVLALSERHGAVCPRSNDATLATLPRFRKHMPTPSLERSAEVFAAVHPSLPRYYVSPIAVGFCLLVRRRIVANHGLFDEIYGAGYNEENDFCMRINDIGYSSLIANHALVFHASSSSFGAERREELDAANAVHLLQRFPYYNDMIERFAASGYSVIDRFADVIVPEDGTPTRVLIDLHHLSKHYDGTTKNVLSLLEHLAANPPGPQIEVVIAAYPDVLAFFQLDGYGLRVLDYTTLAEVFDLGIAVVPVTSMGQLVTLHRLCARIVVAFLDVIALRTYRHVRQTPLKPLVVQASLQWADRVLAISDGALDDAQALYPEALADIRERAVVVTQGSGLTVGVDHSSLTDISRLDESTTGVLQRGGFVLVVGNGFAHKQVVETLSALAGAKYPVVAMADRLIGDRFPDVAIALSGTLTEHEMELAYSRAAVVVCPSAYEGFGLSIAEAAQHGKRVVVFDTSVSREVVARLDLPNVSFFSTFGELPTVLASSLEAPIQPSRGAVRSLRDYARDFWESSIEVLEEPLSVDHLRARDDAISSLALAWGTSVALAERLLYENTDIRQSSTFRLARRLAQVSGLVRRVIPRRHRILEIDRRLIDQT